MPKKNAAGASAETASSDAVQRILIDAANATENFAPTLAEADRIERIMRGEDPVVLWNAFYENRWNRRRKLLPSLRLTYPNDDELKYIAKLAEVNDASSFGHSIHSIILDAHLNDQSFRTLSVPKVRKAISDVAAQTKLLGKILSKLDVGRGSRGSLAEAGELIELELCALQKFKLGGMMQLPEYIVLLDALNIAAQRAVSKPIYSPRGTGGNPAFDMCIQQLLMAARMRRGIWTNFRLKDQTWTGTLLESLEILKKYLPRFFPPGELGRAIDHIRNKLGKHVAGLSHDRKRRS